MNGVERRGGIGMCEEECEGQKRGRSIEETKGEADSLNLSNLVGIRSLPGRKLEGKIQ